jgi:hypothetical protein
VYDIVATVTKDTQDELKLTGAWPLDWWQAPGVRSYEIVRKLLPGETVPPPAVPVITQEILGNRARWPDLRVGDQVIVRIFFPGESR